MPLPPPIFAFGVGNLPMLNWLAAAAAPIVIHLLSKRRFRRIRWAAMDFLLEADRRNRRRVRIEELILLGLRCLARVCSLLPLPVFGLGGIHTGEIPKVLAAGACGVAGITLFQRDLALFSRNA